MEERIRQVIQELNKRYRIIKLVSILQTLIFVCYAYFIIIYFISVDKSVTINILSYKEYNLGMIILVILCISFAIMMFDLHNRSEYLRKYNEEFLIPLTENLLSPCKISDGRISRKEFENNDIFKEYKYEYFYAFGKMTTKIEDKNVVLSRIILSLRMLSSRLFGNKGDLVFNGVFLKGENRKSFYKPITIRRRKKYNKSLAKIYKTYTEIDVTGLSDRDIYAMFDCYYEIICDGNPINPEFFNIEFFRKFMKLHKCSGYKVMYSFVDNFICITIEGAKYLLLEKEFRKKFRENETYEGIKELCLNNFNQIKEYYETALLLNIN